jgi:replication-associated recombination protein RarA
METLQNDLWINKWRPTIIDDIIGNKSVIHKLEEWFINLDKHDNNSIIILGSHGIGKTMIVQMLLEKYNYVYKMIYPDEIKQFRNDADFEDYYNHDNSIIAKVKMKSRDSKKLALVFDETESITLTSERKYVFNIHKVNTKFKKFPLIFISNTNHSKLINDLKKYCIELKFIAPSSYELMSYIRKICSKEKITIEEDGSIEMLVNFSQFDIRRLVNILQEYYYNFNIINITNLTRFIEMSIMKDTNVGLYEASLNLINNVYDLEHIFKLYETVKLI